MEKLSNFVTGGLWGADFAPCRASVCAAPAHRHRTAAPRGPLHARCVRAVAAAPRRGDTSRSALRRSPVCLRRTVSAFSRHPLYTRISRRADHYIFPLPLTMRPELGIITYIVFYMIPSICAFVHAPDTVRLYPPRREVGRPHRRRADRRVYITWNRAGAAARPGAGPAPTGRETGC